MSDDVIVGFHGKPRCAWAGAADTAFGRYHDEVWGTRTYDEPAMFEALTLGVFEVGLSWTIVFGKRGAFRTAFHIDPRQSPRSLADLPASTPQSAELAGQQERPEY
jgi:hypothetical protein